MQTLDGQALKIIQFLEEIEVNLSDEQKADMKADRVDTGNKFMKYLDEALSRDDLSDAFRAKLLAFQTLLLCGAPKPH